jgi:hypothetical protein
VPESEAGEFPTLQDVEHVTVNPLASNTVSPADPESVIAGQVEWATQDPALNPQVVGSFQSPLCVLVKLAPHAPHASNIKTAFDLTIGTRVVQ